MKNKFYLLINSFLLTSLLFSLVIESKAVLPSIPEVGEGVCVSNCPSDSPITFPSPTPTSDDTDITTSPSSMSSETLQTIENSIQSAVELDDQALQKLEEGDYPSVPPIINDAIESLTDARNSLKSDPSLEELREEEPKEVSKIDRSLKSSINNHKRASSAVEKIIKNPKIEENESLLSKFLKKAKKFLLEGRRHTQTTSIAVAGVRG